MVKQWILIAMGCTLSFTVFAQDKKILEGKIVADSLPESSVHIINKSLQTGTVNTASGDFKIEVRVNDTLLFSSLQYKRLEIPVTRDAFHKGYLIVVLNEDVNQLPEVNVSNITLTGNLNTDLANIEVVDDLPVNMSFRSLQKESMFESDRREHPETPVNLALKQNQIGYGAEGMNILGGLGILADLVGIKSKSSPAYNPPEASSVQIRKLFDDEFFKSSLGIKEENIQDFIFYLDDVGLSQQLLKPGKRLALIEVLIVHSKNYNDQLINKG